MNDDVVRIAVIDSGIKYSEKNAHIKQCLTIREVSDESGFCIEDGAEDHYGHGTAVFSIISKGCKDADFYIIKVFEDSEYLSEEVLFEALEYIESNLEVDIINMSLGVPVCEDKERFYGICSRLAEKNVILVSAFDNTGTISYPAAFDCVIGVRSGNECLRTSDFEYIEDTYINIGAKGNQQRVVWTDPPYLMIGGNSFAAAHVTAMAGTFRQNGVKGFSEMLDEFKKISLKHYVSKKAAEQKKLFEIKKAALFPFNKEMHSLVRFRNMLDFEITGIYDVKYSAKVGADVSHILNDDRVFSQVVQNITNIDWLEFDTLILGHTDKLESNTNKHFNKGLLIEEAKKHHINIYSFEDIGELTGDYDRYFCPCVEENQVPAMRFGMLHQPAIPVVGIFGTSSQQGKFTLQLKLRQMLLAHAYDVGQIGTEPSALLYGMDYVFPMGYNGTVRIKEDEVIRYLNDCVHRLDVRKKEIVLVGSQSGTVSYDYGNLSYYTIMQYLFLLGTRPDIVYLCVNPYDEPEYIQRSIYFIESAAACKVCGLVVFPMELKNDWLGVYGGKKTLTEERYQALRQEWGHIFTVPVYSLADDSSMEQLYYDMIDILGQPPEGY